MIHPFCQQKLIELEMAKFTEPFNALAAETKEAATMVLPLYSEETKLKQGDLVAEIHLVVRRV